MTKASRELRFALLLELTNRLRVAGSWCGETHLQKAVFSLETLAKTPLCYEFIMYKHGPFSFDLRDEISGLRAARLIDYELQEGYGPRLKPSELSKLIIERNKKEVSRLAKAYEFVVSWMGKKDVKELEKMTTGLFVTVSRKGSSFAERAHHIRDLKPHISQDEAERALHAAEQKIVESKAAKLV